MAGLLAGLDVFVVGLGFLVALLVLAQIIRPLLVAVLSQAPLIGGWLASNVDAGLATFQRAIAAPADAALGVLVSALDWTVGVARGLAFGSRDAVSALYAAGHALATQTLPYALQQTLIQAEALVDAARAWALGQLMALEVRLGADIAGVASAASAEVQAVRGEALDAVTAAESVVLAEIRKLEGNVGQLFLQAENDLILGVGSAEQIAASLVAAARADLGAAVGAVEHDLQLLAAAERVILADSTAILGADIAAAEARASAALAGLEKSTQQSIEGILSGLPWQALAAGVAGGEAMLQAQVRELVGLGAQAVRQEIGDAEAIRAKYGPQVRAALLQLRKAG